MRCSPATRNTHKGATFALLSALALHLGACDSVEPPLTELTSSHAALTSSEVLRLGVLGIELVTALHEDGPGVDCPTLSSEGSAHVLDYGAGCAPSSGSTEEGISGQVEFTIAPAADWFVGSFDSVGFSGHTIHGEISGSYTRVEEQVFIDLQFTDVQRTDREDLGLSALFEVQGDDEAYVINVDGGLMVGPSLPDTQFQLAGVTVHIGSLDSCVHPTSGSIELRRGTQTGSLDFSPESASSGSVPFTLNDEPYNSLPICS